MKMLVSLLGTKAKPCKTIYILKVSTDSYSDSKKEIYKLAHTSFKVATTTTAKMTNIYLIYQLNIAFHSVRVAKIKLQHITVIWFLLSDILFSRDQNLNSKWPPEKNINPIRSEVFNIHKNMGPNISKPF